MSNRKRISSRSRAKLRRIAKQRAERLGTDWVEEMNEQMRRYRNAKAARRRNNA